MASLFPINLRGARLRLGWTLDRLAGEAEKCVSKAMLSRYEQGASLPTPAVVGQLAKALRVPVSALLTESAFNVDFIAFRKTTHLPAMEQNRIKAETEWRLRLRWDLMRVVGETPAPPVLPRYEAAEKSAAEAHASALRLEWGLGNGPLPNLTNLLEDRAFEVISLRANPAFSGISAWVEHRHPVIVVQHRDDDGARQRMDLAHELGHLVGNPVDADTEEDYAGLFGAALLFPEAAVRREFPVRRNRITLAELKTVKSKYGISFEAILRRLRDLNLLSQEGYSWWYAKGNIRRQEKRETPVPPEMPGRPVRLASRALTEDLVSIDTLAQSGDYPPDVLEDMKQQAPLRRDSLQQEYLRMPAGERRKTFRKEAEELALHYAANRDEILSDLMDDIEE